MSLRKTTFSATRWTTASAVVRAGTQLIQTAVLARILLPSDFGLMAMAGVALAIALLFSDLGLSSALMHQPVPDSTTLSTLFWLNFGIASVLALMFAIGGHALSIAYGEPELVTVMYWLCLCFPLGALGQQFRVLAEKALCFKPLAQNEVISAAAGFSVAAVSAFLGWGVYALVSAQLVSISVNSLLAWLRLTNGHRPSRSFLWTRARPFMAIGMHRLGDNLWNTLLMQTDVFLAGLAAGPHALATYVTPRDQSLKIANLIVNPVLTRVGLPVMTLLKDNPVALRDIYCKTLRLTASFNFPIYAFLAIFPEQFVMMLLGPQWHEAAPFLRIFALWGFIRSTGNPSNSLLYAVGMAKRAHIWNFSFFIGTVPIYWLASKLGGLNSLAWSMAVLQTLTYFLAWRFLIHPSCGITLKEYSASFIPPLASTVLSSAVAYGLAYVCPPTWHLLVGILAFGCTYLLASWWLNRSWLLTIFELIAPIVQRLSTGNEQ